METSSPASRVRANLQELFKADLTPGDAYIRFQLTAEIKALLSMEAVQESLLVEAKQITSLPNMPASVIGILGSRDRVFCVLDLAQLLQLPSPLISPQQYQIIVLEVAELVSSTQSSLYLGLAVNCLEGITRLTSEQLRSPENLPLSLNPYVLKCAGEGEQQKLVLDLQAIAATAFLNRN